MQRVLNFLGQTYAMSHKNLDSPSTTNSHYLQRVVNLSVDNPVRTREDVFDARGLKLLSKGMLVDESTYDRLLRYKLSKPIESLLGVEEGVTVSELANLAEELMAANRELAQTLTSIKAGSIAIKLVKQLTLDPSGRLMLSLQGRENTRLRHGMMVALLAAGFGHQAGLAEAQLSALIAAGVMHDIGELYLDPSIFEKKTSLNLSEWRHIASHPLIGEMVIRQTMPSFPPETARYVSEHHERINGYGYPHLVSGERLSLPGAYLGTAEVVAGILGREGEDTIRIAWALKLIQGEFPAVAVSLIDQTYRVMREVLGIPASLLSGEAIANRADHLGASLNTILAWLQGLLNRTNQSGGVLGFIANRVLDLRQVAFSTGILPSAGVILADLEFSPLEELELQSACQEIQFRLRELSYLASLHPEADTDISRSIIAELGEKFLGTGSLHSTLH